MPLGFLRCTDKGTALPPVGLRPGDPKPVFFRIELPLSAAAAATGKATAHFTVGPTPQFSLKKGVVFPQMPSDHLVVPLELPPLRFYCTLAGNLAPARSATWSDALHGKATQHLLLTCTLRSVPDLPWPSAVTLRLKPKGCRLVSATDTLEFSRPGSRSLPLSLEVEALSPATARFSVALEVQADAPPGFTIDPPHLSLAHEDTIPPSVETRIGTKVQAISKARWSNLAQGLASFNAQVLFTVDGPILADTRLVLVCPHSVRSIVAEPAHLHTGSQTVQLAFTATLPPGPGIETLQVKIQPPSATGAVRYAPPQPLVLRVPGPSPVQMALLNPEGGSPAVTAHDRGNPVLLTGIPVLLTPGDRKATSGLTALVRGGAMLGSQTHGPLPLDTPAILPLAVDSRETSFFFDTVIEENIEVFPSQPSPALLGSRQLCTVRLEAPFKRWLFYGVSTLSVVFLIALFLRVCLRRVPTETS